MPTNPTWESLFERAEAYDVTLDDVHGALTKRRTDEPGDTDGDEKGHEEGDEDDG